MRIRVAFEIGHSSSPKSKASPEGFTHDWELFVRGADGSNINRFVDKVVFNLHDSFPKPCRVYKEPPYVLKESGYANFDLPIDIYLKAGPRDDPKKYSITYDLDITKTTVQKYPLIVPNPSSEFRHKLLEGGGIMINNDSHVNDDRIYSQPDSTTKPRPQSSSSGSVGGKKHKIKTDEIKPTSTFENLFGSPILNSKNSPDPKLSNSSSSKLPVASSGSKIPSQQQQQQPQKSTKDRSSEKSGKEKRDKKDKSGSTKESSSGTSKKSGGGGGGGGDEKHERREEKRKEKSSTKDRERSKEKSSKRPASPKPTSRSPKRSTSPLRANSSNSTRHDSNVKYEEKLSSSSSGKKSKKEKRDKSKERERTTGEPKTKESKHQMHQTKQQKEEKISSKSMEKLNGSSKKDDPELKERDKSTKYRTFDIKPPSPPVDVPLKPPIAADAVQKKSHDKDERKHKHKKKDKNKDKDRKKSKSKDISDESPLSTGATHRKRSNAQTPTQPSNRIPNAKINPPPPAPIPPTNNQLSDKTSSEFDDDDYMDRTSPKPDKVSSSNDTNQSMDHLMDRIPEIVTPRLAAPNELSPKKSTEKSTSAKKPKEPKSNQSSASKEEKKQRKRKNKSDKTKHDDGGSGSKRKIHTSPIDEPPAKLFKKDDEKLLPKIKDECIHETNKLLPGRTPPVPQHLHASPATQKLYHQSPDSSKHTNLKRSADNLLNNQTKLVAHISPPTTSSSPSSADESPKRHTTTTTTTQPIQSPPTNEKQYIAQLKALQHKIMTLQDNDELQQVVEMIAETGCYEITNRTFDFDLCALDRTTVQRLQDRLG